MQHVRSENLQKGNLLLVEAKIQCYVPLDNTSDTPLTLRHRTFKKKGFSDGKLTAKYDMVAILLLVRYDDLMQKHIKEDDYDICI